MQQVLPFRQQKLPRPELRARARAFVRLLVADARKAQSYYKRFPSAQARNAVLAAKRVVRYAYQARHPR